MKLQKTFKKSVLIVTAMALVPCWSVFLRADDNDGDASSNDFVQFIEKPELREFVEALIEARGIYWVGKNAIPWATKAFPILSDATPVIADTASVLAPVAPMVQGVLDNDKRLEIYFERMWGTFLNDPKLLGPSPNHPEISYIRDVFNDATEKVNKAFRDQGIDFQVMPSHVFVSESWDAIQGREDSDRVTPHEITTNSKDKKKCGLWGMGICPTPSEDSFFYVPITDFAFNDREERIEIDIAAQAMLKILPPKFLNYIDTHRENGKARPWYSYFDGDDNMSIVPGAIIYAAQILHLPQPEMNLDVADKTLDMAYEKYLKGYNDRVVSLGNDDSQIEREKKFLSFRIQKYPTTLKGPQSGAATLTPCRADGQDNHLFNHPLPTCRVLHIKDLSDDPKIHEIYQPIVNENLLSKSTRKFRADFWPAQAELLMILLTDAMIGSRLSKFMEGAKWYKKGAILGLRFLVLPGVTVYATDKGYTAMVKGTKYDENYDIRGLDSDLLLSLNLLIGQSRALRVDPDDPKNIETEKMLETQFKKLLLKTDPRFIKILNQIIDTSAADSKS